MSSFAVDNATFQALIEDNQIAAIVPNPLFHVEDVVKSIVNVVSAKTCTIICLDEAIVNFWTFFIDTCRCAQVSTEILSYYLSQNLSTIVFPDEVNTEGTLSYIAFSRKVETSLKTGKCKKTM